MRRFHLLEIEDQPWCPRAVRDGVTDYLRFAADAGKAYAPAAPLLAGALTAAGTDKVVDLAAGGGGPWRSLLPELAREGVQPQVQLTDFQPNAAAFRATERDTGGAVTGQLARVDATAVPTELAGFRTIFSALHHFRPDQVRAMLADASRRREGFAAFEATHRSLRAILLMLITPILALLTIPFIRPLRLSRLFWTYLVPMIPLVVLVDGIVSCLRTYRPDELLSLAREAAPEGYRWDAGEAGSGPIPVTYLIGTPL